MMLYISSGVVKQCETTYLQYTVKLEAQRMGID